MTDTDAPLTVEEIIKAEGWYLDAEPEAQPLKPPFFSRICAAARAWAEQERLPTEIRPNDGAQVINGGCSDTDEVLGTGTLHVEQMDAKCFWAVLYTGDGKRVSMRWQSKKPITLSAFVEPDGPSVSAPQREDAGAPREVEAIKGPSEMLSSDTRSSQPEGGTCTCKFDRGIQMYDVKCPVHVPTSPPQPEGGTLDVTKVAAPGWTRQPEGGVLNVTKVAPLGWTHQPEGGSGELIDDLYLFARESYTHAIASRAADKIREIEAIAKTQCEAAREKEKIAVDLFKKNRELEAKLAEARDPHYPLEVLLSEENDALREKLEAAEKELARLRGLPRIAECEKRFIKLEAQADQAARSLATMRGALEKISDPHCLPHEAWQIARAALASSAAEDD